MRHFHLTCLAIFVLAQTAAANDRPPPRENDPDDFVRYIFEINACVLTEAQLPLGGHYDGSVMDVDGVLWNAAWGGGSVTGFAPDRSIVRTFELPAAQTSCPCFVGPKLDRMIVTSAWEGYSESARNADPGAGFTYMIDGGFRGIDTVAATIDESRLNRN